MNTSTNHDIPEDGAQIGIVVDAGRQLGYGHAVRCLRLAKSLVRRNPVVFYPLSDSCREFIESSGYAVANGTAFPPVVITDLREAHGIIAAIHKQGAKHISIHDLGLAQCHSDIAIDGSITRLFPYPANKDRTLFLGPQYMITRDSVKREKPGDSVLVTFGGGSTAAFAQKISEELVACWVKSDQHSRIHRIRSDDRAGIRSRNVDLPVCNFRFRSNVIRSARLGRSDHCGGFRSTPIANGFGIS